MVDAESNPVAIKWQSQQVNVRLQDLRRALVHHIFFVDAFTADGYEDPRAVLIAAAEAIEPGSTVRVGWLPKTTGSRDTLGRGREWIRTKATAGHTETLMAALHIAAFGLGLEGCIGARLGCAVAKLQPIPEADHSYLWWWRRGEPRAASSFLYESTAVQNLNLQEICED